MKQIQIKIPEFLNGYLTKDLQENEVICEHCQGSGLMIDDNAYGIHGEERKDGKMFPYKKQTIVSCRHCFNGVREKCEYCGKLLQRGYSRCDCDGYKNAERLKEIEKENLIKAKAKTIFFDEYDGYLIHGETVMDKDNFADYYYDNFDANDSPMWTYGVKSSKCFNIDIYEVINQATEDGYEDMYDRLDMGSELLQKAQELINQWEEDNYDQILVYDEDTSVVVDLNSLYDECLDKIERK